MLTLVTYPAAFGQPSASAFCVKAMCFLKMSGADWRANVTADPRKTPKSKLPMLIDGESTIPDSEDIRDYLEQKYNIDFDEGLTPEQRAISRAVIRMCDEHLYFYLICERWLNDDNWEVVKATFFDKIPRLIRGMVTKSIRKQALNSVYGQGVARHSEAERFARADKDIKAIMALVGDKPFLFGDKPTAADASAAPMLASFVGSPSETMLSKRVMTDAPLRAYLDRVEKAIYP